MNFGASKQVYPGGLPGEGGIKLEWGEGLSQRERCFFFMGRTGIVD